MKNDKNGNFKVKGRDLTWFKTMKPGDRSVKDMDLSHQRYGRLTVKKMDLWFVQWRMDLGLNIKLGTLFPDTTIWEFLNRT